MMNRWELALGLCCCVVSPAMLSCGENTKTTGGTDSSTHWLAECKSDPECGGLRCVCGVCTRRCSTAAECRNLDVSATCGDLEGCSEQRVMACRLECTSDVACQRTGSTGKCHDGQCRFVLNPSSSDAASTDSIDGSVSGAGGAGAGAAGSGGAGGAATGGSGSAGAAMGGSGAEPSDAAAGAGDSGRDTDDASLVQVDASLTDGDSGRGRLELPASTLNFFNLPINSVRWGVSGYEPISHTCVSVQWDYSNTMHVDGPHCDDFGMMFPYVTMVHAPDGRCDAWGYGGNIQVDGWTGCVDFDWNYVNSVVHVTSPEFTGPILLDNRSLLPSRPVVFSLQHNAAASPSTLYVQNMAGQGVPAWVSIAKDGVPVELTELCTMPECDRPAKTCYASHNVITIRYDTNARKVAATWDGTIRKVNSDGTCFTKEPAPAGTYHAKVCYGAATVDVTAGKDVVDPTCIERDFIYPTEQVLFEVQ